MRIRPSILALMMALSPVACAAMQPEADGCDAPAVTAYPGYTGCYAGLELVIDDAFDRYDEGVWERSTGGFPDNACRFMDRGRNVRFDGDGLMKLVMEVETVPGSFSRFEQKDVAEKACASGELRTRDEHGPYGRLEARMKSPASSGFIQSLFAFHYYKDPWEEIDIELQGRLPKQVSTNVITNHAKNWQECDIYGCTKNAEGSHDLAAGHAEAWHVFAIDWRPDRIVFSVDGQPFRLVTRKQIDATGGNYPDRATTLLMNFWLPVEKLSPWFGGEWSLDQLPLEAKYDWFRFYRMKDATAARDEHATETASADR